MPKKKTGTLRKDGYKLITVEGKRVFEHRYLMEKFIGKKLDKREQIHHINGIKSDNRIVNLEILDIRKHAEIGYENALGHRRTIFSNFICEVCKKKYVSKRRIKTRRFCGQKCKNKWLSDKWVKNNPKFK